MIARATLYGPYLFRTDQRVQNLQNINTHTKIFTQKSFLRTDRNGSVVRTMLPSLACSVGRFETTTMNKFAFWAARRSRAPPTPRSDAHEGGGLPRRAGRSEVDLRAHGPT